MSGLWTAADLARLAELHGTMSIVEIAKAMGRSRSAVRARITRSGIAKKVSWTAGEEDAVRALYCTAGEAGVLGLKQFAAQMGRDPGCIVRKARQLGLPVSQSRKKVERRKDQPMFATVEERRRHQSALVKRHLAENGHPRGMLGKKHSPETLLVISEASKAQWEGLSEEARQAKVDAMYLKKMAAGGVGPQPVARGTWKAGWREIGGKRNYYRSRWEANYARYLEWLKQHGAIADWQHEPEVFWFEKIKRGVRSYKPDFRVWETSGNSALHEVKGWMDSRSKTCIARMKKYHPSETLIVIDGKQYRAIRLKVMHLIADWEDAARDVRE